MLRTLPMVTRHPLLGRPTPAPTVLARRALVQADAVSWSGGRVGPPTALTPAPGSRASSVSMETAWTMRSQNYPRMDPSSGTTATCLRVCARPVRARRVAAQTQVPSFSPFCSTTPHLRVAGCGSGSAAPALNSVLRMTPPPSSRWRAMRSRTGDGTRFCKRRRRWLTSGSTCWAAFLHSRLARLQPSTGISLVFRDPRIRDGGCYAS